MTNEKQQTAVQNLCMKLANKLGMPNAITFYVDHQKEISEALEMEKEQHENTWDDSFLFKDDWEMKFEQYYNETYGGNK